MRSARHVSARPAAAPRLHPLAAALALCLSAGAQAQGLPTGMQVINGQATVNTVGSQMTVTNSANAILNWRSFSIGAQQSVRFEQASSASQVLNRVTGADPSSILGSLSSNGKVWLLNPHGVLFGAGARVDVAGLVVSTLNLNDADFLAGRYRFGLDANDLGDGRIVNQGELRTASGGRVALLASAGGVANEGLIEAPGGQVLLAAGREIELVDTQAPNLALRVAAPQGEALNLGRVLAPGGRIDVQAAIVNQQGVLRADAFGTGPAGEVVLQATDQLTLAAGSSTGAAGGSGGKVTLDAGAAGTAMVAGQADAIGTAGTGGKLALLGRHVAVLDGGVLDASGTTGGGAVSVGGGLQGRDASLRNAQAAFIAPNARLAADATVQGDGGSVIVWSDQATRAYGHFSARGGAAGGDGGLVETSGGWLDAQPASISVQAAQGAAGTWLIDPNNILITNSASDTNVTGNPNFTTTGDSAVISAGSIRTALNQGNSVTITTSTQSGSTQAGDITLSGATIDVTPNSPVSLTLTAHRNIELISSSITSNGTPLNVTLNAGIAGAGGISLTSSNIDSANGNITLGGPTTATGAHGSAPFAGAVAADANAPAGVYLSSSSLNARNGSITVNGANNVAGGSSTAVGVLIQGNSSLNGNSITVRGWSDGTTTGTAPRTGVEITSSSLTAANSIVVEGAAYGDTDGGNSSAPRSLLLVGVDLDEARLLVQPPGPGATGALRVSGTAVRTGAASSLPAADVGLHVDRSQTGQLLAANGTSMTLEGTLNSADTGYSMLLSNSDQYGGALIDASTAGSLALTGSGTGSQTLGLSGAEILAPTGGSVQITSTDGLLLIDGTNSSIASTITGQPSSVTLQAGGFLALSGDSSISVSGANAPVRLESTAGVLTMSDTATISTGGTVQLRAGTIFLQDRAFVSSTATGDAIVVGGSGGGNAASFFNSTSSAPFSVTSGGRWLVYAATPDSTLFDAGTLVHDFRQYNATSGSTVLGTGNGVLFSLAPTLTLSGALTKVYDGSASITLDASNVQVTGSQPGDSATINATVGTFADAHASPTAKAITVAPSALTVNDSAGKPVYGYTYNVGALTGTVTQRQVTLVGGSLVAADKVYDGNTVAAVTLSPSSGLSGVLSNENLSFTAVGNFADANAGTGKTVNVTLSLANGTASSSQNAGLASDYQLVSGGTATTTASITPKALQVAISAADKVYDGTTRANVGLAGVTGLVGSEQLAFTLSGDFSDANAGTGKSVVATVTASNAGGALASNYAIPSSAVTSAGISQATLTYVADALSTAVGNELPPMTGTVTGFVAGETLSGATTGTLAFGTAASSASPAGSYAVDGSGLSAVNYRFVQAAGNATALTLTGTVQPPAPPLTPPEAAAPLQQSTPVELAQALAVLPSISILPAPLQDRALDATQALIPGEGLRFRSVPVESMSQEALAALLASRDRLKQGIFADALSTLAVDPKAADVKPCESPQQAETGTCMITDLQRDQVLAARIAAASRVAVGTALSPAPSPTPAATAPATAAAPPAPAPSAAPAAPPAPAPAAAAPVQPPPSLFAARASVRTAALPQIQRKLAVLIGTDRYQDARIPQLDNAVSDARAVARLLETSLGYETVVVEDGSKANIMRTLNRLATEAGPNDSIVIYYAGHGAVVQSTGEGYWQPSDADATRAETWISNADIGRAVERLGSTQVALISDSCYSGTLVSDARIRAAAAALDPTQVLSRRTAVVMSSGGNEPVFDAGKEGHSTFAWNLMRTLQQVPTWQPGGNVFERVRFAVARELPQRPQYGAVSSAGYASGADYLFEKRELTK